MSKINFFKKKYNFYKKKSFNKGNLLLIDRERIDIVFHQSILSLALSNKFNLNTTILTDKSPNSLVVSIYKKLGFDDFISGFSKKKLFLNPLLLLTTTFHFIISLVKLKFFGFEWLINRFNIKKIFIGDLIYDSNVRYDHRFQNLKIDFHFLKLHFSSIFRFFIIFNYIKKLGIKKILVGSETGSRNQGLALRISSKMKIKNYAFYRVYNNGISLISFNHNYYKNGIDNISINKFKKLSAKLSKKKINNLYYNRKKLKTKNWYTMLDYKYSNLSNSKSDEYLKSLSKNKKKKILFASHAFADAPHASGTFIFKDYYEQFVETLKFAYNSSDTNLWIFKNHPNSRLYGEKKIFSDLIKKFKKENILLCPDKIPTQKLLNICDVVITGRGTIGIEFACLGKKTIIAGSAPYSGIGIVQEAKNQRDYFRYLEEINNTNKLKKSKSIEIKAKKLLYIFENSLNLRTIKIESFSKQSKFRKFLNLIHTKNFNQNNVFYYYKDILENGVLNSEIYNKLIKII